MPRQAKPPAEPIEMPRTEGDLDILMTAIEKHKAAGHKIGTLINEEKIDAEEALNRAAAEDDKLYTVLDNMQIEREEELEGDQDE